jgi:hypothetical protein
MIKTPPLILIALFLCLPCFAQHSAGLDPVKQLQAYEDTLVNLGKTFVNNENDLERKNANYQFIKTLVSALRVPNSFLYPFDSLKSVTIVNSPDNRFRFITWHITNEDGSYRFYGTAQINTGGRLLMYPLNDYSPFIKNPEDTITNNLKWYGAQYYKIVPVYSPKLYYVLIGWKGNTVKSTKKVIDVFTFDDNHPIFGEPVFEGNGKTRKRVVFEYSRDVSMLLRYVDDQQFIVFDHLSPPDPKLKGDYTTYGPDLSYDGYKLKNGHWVYVSGLDMRNMPEKRDSELADPKKQAAADKAAAGVH